MASPKVSTTTGQDPPLSVASPVTKVYNPAIVGTPHAVLYNSGSSFAYLGGSAVTPSSGFPFPPGAQITLPYANFSIWGVPGGVTVGTPSTSLQTALAAGGTTLTLASSGTVFATAQTIAVGATTGQEFLTIATITGTVVTLSAPTLYDHNASATVTTILSQSATSLSVNMGTT
jgi:hypothetical protein